MDPKTADDPIPAVTVTPKDQEPMRPELLALFDLGELEKYYTPAELAGHPAAAGNSTEREA